MEETRNKLRNAALKRRAALDPATCRSWSGLIQAKILELPGYRFCCTVAVYRPLGNEVDTAVIIDHALTHGKKVFVPRPGTEEPGVFVPVVREEPQREDASAQSANLSAEQTPLIVLIPGVLFDSEGNRLGRGGGWYDRTLHALGGGGLHVALAYELQVTDRLPAQPWDARVHYVVTESRVIDCRLSLSGRVAR